MYLGTQYYRAPFPNEKYWDEDFSRIRDCGLNTVQLWVIWSWVESKPGRFVYDDYDRLVALAEKKGLNVVLSTIAEIHPLWIHREIPGSEMVDNFGHKVMSSSRNEVHFGLTPGGCWDNRAVWDRMAAFIEETVKRYRGLGNLAGWDAWNELRWNVHADAFVCYCEHSLKRFRDWLSERHGGLEGLNEYWIRRYGTWDEVRPGKTCVRPFTEMNAFQHFITWRANQHAIDRCRLIESLDDKHPVTVHAATPAPYMAGDTPIGGPTTGEFNQAINRGNDWFFADELQGIGTSSFPNWVGESDTDFQVRINVVHSAARGKKVWLSELQGSAAINPNRLHAPVPARSQQHWLWHGLAHGADTILFWCWRDEVFGCESGGFGLTGGDGYAEERLAAMRRTADIIGRHGATLADFKLDKAEVGVFFSPQSYYTAWCQDGNAAQCMHALLAYSRALSRLGIRYLAVEEDHLEQLEGLKLLFLPRVLVLDPKTEAALEKFVLNGGTIVTESEGGAYDSRGFWRYPADRLTARLTGIRETGRRRLQRDSVSVYTGNEQLEIGLSQWLTPLEGGKGKVLAPFQDIKAPASLLTEACAGRGRVIMAGSYLGNGVTDDNFRFFDTLVGHLVETSGVVRPVRLFGRAASEGVFQVYLGSSRGKRMVMAFAPEDCAELGLEFVPGVFRSRHATDLMTGKRLCLGEGRCELELEFDENSWGIAVLVED